MQKKLKLSLEMFVVGSVLALLGFLVSYVSDIIQHKQIKLWPKHAWGMLTGTFVTGALFHGLAEITGINQWYAEQYERLI